MKLGVFVGGIALITATSSLACPWAGGSYYGKEQQFRTDFSVNGDCSEIEFTSSGSAGFQDADKVAKVPMVRTGSTWVAKGGEVTLTLEDDGKWITFDAPGVVNRRLRVTKK